MPNLPTQPYNRWGAFGTGVGDIITGILSANRQADVANYAKEHPDAPPEELLPLARGDRRSQELIQTIMQGRLQKLQMQEAQTKAIRDLAEANRANAGAQLDAVKGLVEQMTLRQEPLKQKMLEAEIAEKRAAAAGHLDEIQTHRLTREKLEAEIKNLQTGTAVLNQMLPSLVTPSVAPTPGDVEPSSAAPQATPQQGAAPTPAAGAPSRAGYPSGSPDFVESLDKTTSQLRDWLKTPQGQGQDTTASVRSGGIGITQKVARGKPVDQTETSRAESLVSLAQVLGSINESLVRDEKTGKLQLGPIKGPIGQLVARFKQNPDDPNVQMGVLTGHADITAGALMPNTRQGFNFLRLLREILVSPSRGAGFNEDALKNSMRILVNEANGMAANQLQRRAIGADPTPFEEIGRIAKQTFAAGQGGDVTIGKTTIKAADIDKIAKGEGKTRQQIIDQLTKELGGGTP